MKNTITTIVVAASIVAAPAFADNDPSGTAHVVDAAIAKVCGDTEAVKVHGDKAMAKVESMDIPPMQQVGRMMRSKVMFEALVKVAQDENISCEEMNAKRDEIVAKAIAK